MSDTTEQTDNKIVKYAQWYVGQQLQAALETYIRVLDHEGIDCEDKEERRKELEATFAVAYDLAVLNVRQDDDGTDAVTYIERKVTAHYDVIRGTHWLRDVLKTIKGDDDASK